MADRAKDNWLKTAVSFLHTKVGDKRAHTDENTTIYRTKAYEWLLATNNNLAVLADLSWTVFLASEESGSD